MKDRPRGGIQSFGRRSEENLNLENKPDMLFFPPLSTTLVKMPLSKVLNSPLVLLTGTRLRLDWVLMPVTE